MTKGTGDSQSPVAPVDLSQAIIGPGMAVFSKYAAVLEADGTPMSVRTALQLINRFLAEDDFDHDTQFCLHWFEQHGWEDGKFGDADTLARAKGTSVDGVKQAGVLFAVGGIVRLLKWSDYPTDWDPSKDPRLPVWEVLHQLIRVFKTDGESWCRSRPCRDSRQRRSHSAACVSTLHALLNAPAGPRMPEPTTRSSRAGAPSSRPLLRTPVPRQATLFG